MTNLILDPNEKKLVDPAYDKYMDAPATRRQLQEMIDHFARHLDEIYGTLDTQHIVVNFLAEKLNVTKAELDAYVAKKLQELADLAAKKQASEVANERPNG